MSRVREFIVQLFEDGVVRLRDSSVPDAAEVRDAAAWVKNAEIELRQHWPPHPPAIDTSALECVIDQFYRAAQLAVFRELGPEEITQRLQPQIRISPDSAEAIYSVDLVLRFLPDLVRIIKAMNPDDPLLQIVRGWAAQWPMSSMGIPELTCGPVEPILAHPCLSQLYVDRIIETEARDRLDQPLVAERVRGALGAYPELSPKLYRLLNPSSDSHSEYVS